MDVRERKRNFGNDIAQKNFWNYDNWIAEIGGLKKEKKKRKLNCGKSNATATNYFIIFLQTVIIVNFLLVLIRAHI